MAKATRTETRHRARGGISTSDAEDYRSRMRPSGPAVSSSTSLADIDLAFGEKGALLLHDMLNELFLGRWIIIKADANPVRHGR